MRTTEGGSGGVVVCLGVGGLVDLSEILCLTADGEGGEGETAEDMGGVEVWVIDARRPWNLGNVFGGLAVSRQHLEDGNSRSLKTRGVEKGCINESYASGRGGIIVFDDGDIEEELTAEREAYCALEEMPEIDEDEDDYGSSDDSESDNDAGIGSGSSGKKRKSWSGRDEEDEYDEDDEPPRQRRRSNSVCYFHFCGAYRRLTLLSELSHTFVTQQNCIARLLQLVAFSFPSFRLTVTSSPEAAFSTYAETTTDSFEKKTRERATFLLQYGNVLFGAYIVPSIFPSIRTGSRRQ